MVVTVGFFDGVHTGHRRVIDVLKSEGEDVAVVTFWPHPRVVLQKDADRLRLLTSLDEKLAMLHDLGVDNVRVIDFDKKFAAVRAEDFIRNVLVGEMGCTVLVLGHDNRLGSDGLDTEQIASLARNMGLKVVIVPALSVNGENVSSTAIRRALAEGNVAKASAMLGYDYRLKGMVVTGNRLGRTIGFPTANLNPSFALKTIPGGGVYSTRVRFGGREYDSMTNIGTRPTVDGTSGITVETNIFDFDEDIYGMEIELSFSERIRDERRFGSLDELKRRLTLDKELCYGRIQER